MLSTSCLGSLVVVIHRGLRHTFLQSYFTCTDVNGHTPLFQTVSTVSLSDEDWGDTAFYCDPSWASWCGGEGHHRGTSSNVDLVMTTDGVKPLLLGFRPKIGTRLWWKLSSLWAVPSIFWWQTVHGELDNDPTRTQSYCDYDSKLPHVGVRRNMSVLCHCTNPSDHYIRGSCH